MDLNKAIEYLREKGLEIKKEDGKYCLDEETIKQFYKKIRLEGVDLPEVPHEKAEKLHRIGMVDRQIAEELLVPRYKVSQWRRENKLRANQTPKRSNDEFVERFRLWQQGFSDAEAARRVGMSAGGFSGWRKKYRLPSQDIRDKSKNYLAKGKRIDNGEWVEGLPKRKRPRRKDSREMLCKIGKIVDGHWKWFEVEPDSFQYSGHQYLK